jgi:gluconolactonase
MKLEIYGVKQWVILFQSVGLCLAFGHAPAGGQDKGDSGKVFHLDTLEKVATGFQFTEGPVWHGGGFLLFSDIPANLIRRWEPGQEPTVFRNPSHNSNGLTYDNEGQLLACEHGSRKVTRTRTDGEIAVVAERFEGKRLNSPNDIVVAKNGRIYFTDPPYGVEEEDRELDFCGVYSIDPDGTLHLEYQGFTRPNGLALSPDQTILYVACSSDESLNAFPVGADGRLGEPNHFGDPTLPWGDGMKVDTQGNVYVTSDGGVWIWDKDGNWIGLLEIEETPANCAFAGQDSMDFYITARTSLYRIRAKIPGIHPVGSK